MKLTVVVPFYFGLPGKNDLLSRCIASLEGHDELIIIGHRSQSLPWALNQGLMASHGEFILIMSDDMYLLRGNLAELCHPEFVTHPLVNEEPSIFGGAMCFPRAIHEAVGLYDENFREAYYDDDDMITRIEKAGYERRVVQAVNFGHPIGGTTFRELNKNAQLNKNYYESKWGPWEPCSTPPSL